MTFHIEGNSLEQRVAFVVAMGRNFHDAIQTVALEVVEKILDDGNSNHLQTLLKAFGPRTVVQFQSWVAGHTGIRFADGKVVLRKGKWQDPEYWDLQSMRDVRWDTYQKAQKEPVDKGLEDLRKVLEKFAENENTLENAAEWALHLRGLIADDREPTVPVVQRAA